VGTGLRSRAKTETLYTASPAEPTPRSLGPLDAELRGRCLPERHIEIDGNVIAVERQAPLPPGYGGPPRRQVELLSLTGSRVGAIDVSEVEAESFTFAHGELAAAVTPCVESVLVTTREGEPAVKAPPSQCARPRLERLSHAGREVQVTLACPASPPVGCVDASAIVQLPHVRGRNSSTETDSRWMLPGERAVVSARLSPAQGRWMNRHRGAKVRVSVFGGGFEQHEREATLR
jgi:hypothetical protein